MAPGPAQGATEVNAEMAQGVQLLDDQLVDEALELFTRVPWWRPGAAGVVGFVGRL